MTSQSKNEMPAPADTVAGLRGELARSLTGGPWGEAAAVASLLNFEPIAGHPRFARYVDRGGIDWDNALKDRTWSTGERFLIATAAALWSGHPSGADLSRVPFLTDDFYAAWLAMITASRTGKTA
ncbi:MAG: hypothetical protein ABSF03_28885 [Streptosporangiaceae bacterium]